MGFFWWRTHLIYIWDIVFPWDALGRVFFKLWIEPLLIEISELFFYFSPPSLDNDSLAGLAPALNVLSRCSKNISFHLHFLLTQCATCILSDKFSISIVVAGQSLSISIEQSFGRAVIIDEIEGISKKKIFLLLLR